MNKLNYAYYPGCSLHASAGEYDLSTRELFKSLGIAIEDLASAHRIYEICSERELGTWVDIGGAHFGAAAED